MPEPNGWNEWSKYVLKELERLNNCYEKILARQITIEKEIVALKIKAGIWGTIGGAIPAAIALLLWWLKTRL